MKTNFSFKVVILSAVLFVASIAASARVFDGQLIYNPIEENGMMVGQTVYKKDGNTLANYMKHNYKYDEQKRMVKSETQKWSAAKEQWENDLRIEYAYSGKTVTTTYYKWNNKKNTYVLVPEMTVTMDTEL
ncbi:DUF3836 domain-containing protein [Bacteroides pyogenes]|uniref:DUF3836 domain-containing protein n=1 Tax=Bacteroides pyogenes TaxID=310300 RepID=UPI0003DDA344|nr:DUF3836 domain-containing protein [Bacteroides pyogenes]MBB3894162.1 hypothetical protein [Bacteroides pyogenes]GAE20722.1 hypothetical protein JCM10003_79 [Bacteroides pyogenes JCM 10003]SUV31960.1 Family of uncharacterised function (DUF3836) [Bacteroides pyogenes]